MALEPPRRRALLLFGIVALGLGVRLAGSGRSLYNDDFFSLYWIGRGLDYIWGAGRAAESNPPLFYTMLLAWTHLFGTGETMARLPSILSSVAAIPLVYRIGVTIMDARAGLLAATLLALNPVQVSLSAQARSYGLQTFLAALCLLGVALFISERPAGRAVRIRGLATYTVGAVLLAYTHYAQTCLIAACGLGGLIWCLYLRKWTLAWQWVGTNVIVLLASADEIPFMITPHGYAGLDLIRVAPAQIPGTLLLMLSGVTLPAAQAVLAMMAGISAWRLRAAAPAGSAQLVLLGIPLLYLLILGIGNIWYPLLTAKVLVVLAIPVSLLLGRLLAGLPSARGYAILAYGLFSFYIFSIPAAAQGTPFRQMFRELAANAVPGETIVFGPHDRIGALAYYQPGLLKPFVGRWTANDIVPFMIEDRLWADLFSVQPLATADLARMISEGRPVDLITNDVLYARFARKLGRAPDNVIGNDLVRIYQWNVHKS